MKLHCIGEVIFGLLICVSFAGADSLQLRNGRQLQGKYIGGTSTVIGFMSGASVAYFSTADILAVIFDTGTESSLGDMRAPQPMSGADTGARIAFRAHAVRAGQARSTKYVAGYVRPSSSSIPSIRKPRNAALLLSTSSTVSTN